jgi:hypothetical protein
MPTGSELNSLLSIPISYGGSAHFGSHNLDAGQPANALNRIGKEPGANCGKKQYARPDLR